MRCQLPLSEAVHPELFRARLVTKQLNVAAAHTPPFLRRMARAASPKARGGRSARRSARLKKPAIGVLNLEAAHTPPFLRRQSNTKLNLAAAVTPPYLKERRLLHPQFDDSADQHRKLEGKSDSRAAFNHGEGEIDPSDVWLNSNICRL